jgi:hypothetical protein
VHLLFDGNLLSIATVLCNSNYLAAPLAVIFAPHTLPTPMEKLHPVAAFLSNEILDPNRQSQLRAFAMVLLSPQLLQWDSTLYR